MNILNLAFYRFFDWPEFESAREGLKALGARYEVRGKLILTPEGLNGFVAGEEPVLRAYFEEFKTFHPEFPQFEVKESFSDTIPFRRYLVKLKREIIPMGREDVRPKLKTGERLQPEQLKEWLDQGKPLVLLDTRNTYEIEKGTFNGAVHWDLKHFRTFPAHLEAHREELQDKTVVMFCTGGIRCEKTTALALNLGLKEVYQLEGGILKYFERCGNAHYTGDCFVFDERGGVDPELKPAHFETPPSWGIPPIEPQ